MQSSLHLSYTISVEGEKSGGTVFHPQGEDIVTISGKVIRITSLANRSNQRGHDNQITCLDLSNNGRLVASGQKGNNSDVLVWDYQPGKIIFRLSEHDHEVSIVKFSHDDRYNAIIRLLYSAGNFLDKKMFIWDTKTGNIVASAAVSEPLVAVCWGGFVRDIKWRETQNYRFAELSPNKITLGELDCKVGHIQRESINVQGAKREFTCASFSLNETKFLFVGTSSADFFIIDHKNKVLQTIVSVGALGVRQILPLNAESIAVGCGNGVLARFQFDTKGSHLISELNLQHGIGSLSASGNEILVATSRAQAMIVRFKESQPFLVQESHTKEVSFAKFKDRDNNTFGTVSDDGTIRIWDGKSKTVKGRIHFGGQITPSCLQIKEDLIFSGWSDSSLKMHDAQNFGLIWSLDKCQKGGVTALSLASSSKQICTGGQDGTVRLWSLQTKSMNASLQEHAGQITKVQFAQCDSQLITSSKDKSIFLWSVERQKRIQSFYHSFGSVNSFDTWNNGQLIASTGQDRKISLWDIRNPVPVKTFSTDSNPKTAEECYGLKVFNNGSKMITCGEADKLKLWDLGQGSMIAEQSAGSMGMKSLGVSEDSKSAIIGHGDGSISIWQLPF